MKEIRGILESHEDDVKIANINFAYSNDEVIALLRKRGKAVIVQKEMQEKKIDAEIEKELQTNKRDLIAPVSAFITFETEKGHDLALNMYPELSEF